MKTYTSDFAPSNTLMSTMKVFNCSVESHCTNCSVLDDEWDKCIAMIEITVEFCANILLIIFYGSSCVCVSVLDCHLN